MIAVLNCMDNSKYGRKMTKHKLFMLYSWLEEDGQGPYYCPDCGVIEGFFYYSPAIREEIEVINVDFPRPRNTIIELLGIEHQYSPCP